mmetsp:Transcript_3159/g.7495  ORF Transcript_3159/g.7495 Transcript_3159/m.7495 type:complete len:87 (+) Transcript_3159:2517-2777(+)
MERRSSIGRSLKADLSTTTSGGGNDGLQRRKSKSYSPQVIIVESLTLDRGSLLLMRDGSKEICLPPVSSLPPDSTWAVLLSRPVFS